MINWISVEDKKPVGLCLVLLEKDHCHSKIHGAYFEENDKFTIVGGHFSWDVPKVTHWCPQSELNLPEGVSYEN